MTETRTVTLHNGLTALLTEAGQGRPALVLHGGGGPATVAGIAEHLARTRHVLTPTHPGWNGTPRPDGPSGVAGLAAGYLRHLQDRGLRDVLVIGSSLGGWIAADMAVRDTGADTIGGLVLIDAVGVRIEGEPITDFFALDARGVAEHSYHDPDRFQVDRALVPADQLSFRQGNMTTMRAIAGDPYMHDPLLLDRLRDVRVPALLLWGESDRIVTPAYGAAYARAFADARFEVVPRAGHLPQIEQPAATLAAIDAYAARDVRRSG
ncbi:alpha/beta fold hydrolase [Streptomyces sp. NPDC002033]|uniref:alpha/beta fold hydrolase n=1 Tax=unclassified Streptomyces TaxID=2593676 RepID=UPI0033291F5F